MIRRVAVGAAALCIAAAPTAAQTVTVAGPPSNPITDGVGTFVITASNFAPADFPLRLQLQVSSNADFSGLLFADTTVNGPSATIVIPRLLPSNGDLYWRAFALTARAGSVPSAVTGPRVAPTHLRLISPNNRAGQSIRTRFPRFVWTSSRIPASVGQWDYELRIEETATGNVRQTIATTDTAVTLSDPLEANTSYRWRVRARLRATNDSLVVPSLASFVITSDDAPLTTLLFNPFPSPFPSASGSSLCVWFDLSAPSTVSLEIMDGRGLLVRRIVPGAGLPGALAAGRYGRPSPDATSGCDDRFAWDGTDARGRVVPPGHYVVRLVANGKPFTKAVVFQGR